MIQLAKLALEFEKGLNEALGDNNEVQFKIWAEAGQFTKARREGNEITYFINGNLTTSSSSNDANNLVMGVNGLSLEFAIPTIPPRTNATQTAQELAKISDGQYPFVQYIVNAINSYFAKAHVTTMTDDSGSEFTVAFRAGVSVSGSADILPEIGEAFTASVYIEVYFIEGGINSKDVIVFFDGSPIPFQAVRHGRSPMLERDVYENSLVSKSIITSTALAVDVDFPLNSDDATQACLSYLLNGEPNVAHFVELQIGEGNSKLFLMTLNTVQTSAAGISVAGASVSLVEVIDNSSAFNVPDAFQVGRFRLEDYTNISRISVIVSDSCYAAIGGSVLYLVGNIERFIPLTPSYIKYNEVDDEYYVYLVTSKAVKAASDFDFEIIKEGKSDD